MEKGLIPAHIRNAVPLNTVLQAITRQIYKNIDEWINNMQNIESLKKAVKASYYATSVLQYLQEIIPAYPGIVTSIASYTVSYIVQIESFLKETLQIYAGVLRPFDIWKENTLKDTSILDPRLQATDALQIALLDFKFPFQLLPVNFANFSQFNASKREITAKIEQELRQALIMFGVGQDRPKNVSFSIVDRLFIISTDQFQLGLHTWLTDSTPNQFNLIDHYASSSELIFEVSRVNFCPELTKTVGSTAIKNAIKNVEDYIVEILNTKNIKQNSLHDDAEVSFELRNVMYPRNFIRNVCITFSEVILQELLIKTQQKWVLNLQRNVTQSINTKQIPNSEGIFIFWDYRAEEHFNEDTRYFRELRHNRQEVNVDEQTKQQDKIRKPRPVMAIVMRVSNQALIEQLTTQNNQEFNQTLFNLGIFPHYQIEQIWKDKALLSELKYTQPGAGQRTLRSICNVKHPSKQQSAQKTIYFIQIIKYDIEKLSLKVYGGQHVHFSELDDHIAKMRQQLINLQYSGVLNKLNGLYQVKNHKSFIFVDISEHITVFVRLGLNLILYTVYYKTGTYNLGKHKSVDITNIINDLLGQPQIQYSQLDEFLTYISEKSPIINKYMLFLSLINEKLPGNIVHTSNSITYSVTQHFCVHFTPEEVWFIIRINNEEVQHIKLNIQGLQHHESGFDFVKDFLFENLQELSLKNPNVTKDNVVREVIKQFYELKKTKQQELRFEQRYNLPSCQIEYGESDTVSLLNVRVKEQQQVIQYNTQINIKNANIQQKLLQLLIQFYNSKISNYIRLIASIVDDCVIVHLSVQSPNNIITNYKSLDKSSEIIYLLKQKSDNLVIDKEIYLHPRFSNRYYEYPVCQKSNNQGFVMLSSFINSKEDSFILSERVIDPIIQLDNNLDIRKIAILVQLRQIINFYGIPDQIGTWDDTYNQQYYNHSDQTLKQKEYYQFFDYMLNSSSKIKLTGNKQTISVQFDPQTETFIVNKSSTNIEEY